jgi:hypothetical protein
MYSMPHIGSFLLGISPIIGVLGWLQAIYYFDYFSAQWITWSFDIFDFIKFGTTLSMLLVLFTFMALGGYLGKDIEEGKIKFNRNVNLFIFSFIGIFLLSFMKSFLWYSYLNRYFTIDLLEFIILLTMTANGFALIIIDSTQNFREPNFKWVLSLLVTMMFVFLPIRTGVLWANFHLNSNNPFLTSMNLPSIKLKENTNLNYRLLYKKDNEFYIILLQKKHANKIFITTKEEIDYVLTNKNYE